MIRLLRGSVCVLLCLFLAAVPEAGAAETARDIRGGSLVTAQEGFSNLDGLFDGNTVRAQGYPDHSWLTLESGEGIGSLYLIFDVEYGGYSVTDNGTGATAWFGEQGFLHDFLDLEAAFGAAPVSVTVAFDSGPVRLNELYVFTPGQAPDFVQRWEAPAEGQADLVLFSAHGDDEQLFFAGLLPYYAGELGYQVQVVYLTNHRNLTTERCHEMLDGLWTVGVRNYPVFGAFGDYYSLSLEDAYSMFQNAGVSEEELVGFVTEQLRRFKPMVAVGHDVEGEYGHGQHMLYADVLMKAAALSGDPEQYPESAAGFGVWDVPKTYLHLYPENPVVLDWDRPLERFGGMTAYQVTKHLGYPCHKSQFQDFAWYFTGRETAAQIGKYSPCQYGLYRSTVGPDLKKDDLFENLTAYSAPAGELAVPTEGTLAALPEETKAAAVPQETQLRQEPEQRNRHPALAAALLLFLALVPAAVLWRRRGKK
ncbi:MAG: PIG-L deacetylase family protein [Faecousia sp.]